MDRPAVAELMADVSAALARRVSVLCEDVYEVILQEIPQLNGFRGRMGALSDARRNRWYGAAGIRIDQRAASRGQAGSLDRRYPAPAGRSHPRPRIEHRIVPVVRLRPGRLRGTLRGEGHAVRRAAQGRSRHLGGQDPRAPAEPGRGAAHRVRSVPGVDRCRRQPAVGDPRRPPRVLAGAGHHRRSAGPVRRVFAAVPASPGEVRPPVASGAHALAGPRRGYRRAGESGVLAGGVEDDVLDVVPRPQSRTRSSHGRLGPQPA